MEAYDVRLNQKHPDTWHPTLYAISGKSACDQTRTPRMIGSVRSVEALQKISGLARCNSGREEDDLIATAVA